MIRTTVAVLPTRNVRDLLLNRRFKIVRQFPGGRQIELGAGETRYRARKAAAGALRSSGSPTAGGTYTPGYKPGSDGSGGGNRGGANKIVIQRV